MQPRSIFASLALGSLVLSACTPVTAPTPGTGEGSSSAVSSSSATSASVPTNKPVDLPSSYMLPVPFTAQAPFGVWDELHEETCEEAVLIMLAYFEKKEPLTPEIADAALKELVEWETAHGYGVDIGAEEMADIGKEKFGIETTIRKEVTEETVKRALVTGHPVIIPTAGRELGNPYYSGEGPWYHALVVIGYRTGLLGTTYFITNDPGTKRGEHYEYKASTVLDAIHDWPGVKERIAEGPRAMVVVEAD